MVHPGEALVEAQVAVGKALMIDTEGLEHGSIEVIYMHGVFQNVVGVIIGKAVFHSCLESASCNPCGEATSVVVTPVAVLGQLALGVNRTPEFTTEDDNGIIEQTALLHKSGGKTGEWQNDDYR